MNSRQIYIWKKAPFIRFLIPLVGGIAYEYYEGPASSTIWVMLLTAFILFISGFLVSLYLLVKLQVLIGISAAVMLFSTGCVLTHLQNVKKRPSWFGHFYHPGTVVQITISEQPIEKQNSYKATATVDLVAGEYRPNFTEGRIIVYFKKDKVLSLGCGSQILFSTPLQEITDNSNPGGFDFKQFCFFEGITHQVYLNRSDYVVLGKKDLPFKNKILVPLRKTILSILRRYLPGKKEYGLAEALLIGYKDDLDKILVQSYTRTGVVHIIAISGMHIALIYWLLDCLCMPLRRIKHSGWPATIIIICGLWIFSLLTGAEASVVRSAVMFTCIVLGKTLSRSASIYNTLAVSAFILLCYDPFWLWDVGFQLSYAAVLSIVVFSRAIYNWFYIKNKILDFIWKMISVSIAAQLLTTPFSIYHFHQFPNYFLLTNLLAVPLSSLIVLGEIFVCAVSILPAIASPSGKIISGTIWMMNSYVERIENLPWSLWNGMQLSFLQAADLIVIVAALGRWFLNMQKQGVWVALFASLVFVTLRTASFVSSNFQKKIIVYNLPRVKAIDLIEGRKHFFIGDSSVAVNNTLLYLSRSTFRAELPAVAFRNLWLRRNLVCFNSKKILLIDTRINPDTAENRIPIDLLIISKKADFRFSKIIKMFDIKCVVIDASVNPGKVKYWSKDCDSLHIPFWNVKNTGAFVMSLN